METSFSPDPGAQIERRGGPPAYCTIPRNLLWAPRGALLKFPATIPRQKYRNPPRAET